MTELIQQARVPIKKIQMNKAKNQPLQQKLAQQIAQDPALKHMAQKAFVSYMRSLHLQASPPYSISLFLYAEPASAGTTPLLFERERAVARTRACLLLFELRG